MKIKFLATGSAPDYYEFEGEKITAHINGQSDEFDLSAINTGDLFQGLETELDLSDRQIIRHAERINGELYVTLCQISPEGHWRGIDEWIDADNYDQESLYIEEVIDNG